MGVTAKDLILNLLRIFEADTDAPYQKSFDIDVSKFTPMVSHPGAPNIVHKGAVESCKSGNSFEVNFDHGEISVGAKKFRFQPLPDKLRQIIDKKGLVNYMKSM